MSVSQSQFTLDIERIRKDARQQTEDGAVTARYAADKDVIIKMLDASVATEWLCMLRYYQHSLAAQGIHADSVAEHFAEHAKQEHDHAMALGQRIRQLGGTPHLDPSTFTARSHAQYVECDNLLAMIKENLIAERIAVESYTEMVRYIGDSDPTTRRLLEGILETEEEHADEMADLLAALDPGERFSN